MKEQRRAQAYESKIQSPNAQAVPGMAQLHAYLRSLPQDSPASVEKKGKICLLKGQRKIIKRFLMGHGPVDLVKLMCEL